MRLRNQLFISGGALVTAALVGLLLGMFSIWQLSKTQNEAMTRNMNIIDASLGLRQEMGTQVILIIADKLDRPALKASDARFNEWLRKAADDSMNASDHQAVIEIQRTYGLYQKFLDSPATVRRHLLKDDNFTLALSALRDSINTMQMHYVSQVHLEQQNVRERTWLITTLLGLIGLAVLLISFVTAHSVARRLGRPIEELAIAADQIGRGDFHVSLPTPPVTEIASLSRRFGLMAEALRAFKNSDIQALKAEQQRLNAVLDSIDDGLLIFDRQGDVEHFNPVAQRQLAWDESQLGQQAPLTLQHSDLQTQLYRVLQGKPLEEALEDLQVDIDGEQRLLAYSLAAVSHDGEQPSGAVMVLRDVTEQRAFERVRSEFVLRASHELRTPVTGMLMAFSLLQERMKFPEETREADLLSTVDEEMQRLLRLINDLLNFSRYQNGLQSLERVECSIEPLLRMAQQRFDVQAAELQVALQYEAEEDLPLLQVDPLQIERVLDNLIGNALRHSHPGGTVQLRARRRDDRVELSVTDNGEGIPFRQQARIFEPFVQVSRKKGGAGLGLALCKEIVQLHGGSIGVKSRVGQGTQFYVLLPT
ncbi:Alginate biosynthesis sensor protein KinB [Pseudomonas guineae]|uniref:histidine kinase n=1 Tax=Pseudomonas guineae TaxID=425504 RepID=A0A1I3FXD0_9PSED|nr:ATP-binding protein [Pseudomonas guineae]SFI15571.1 Alginate biosynthesis sensor protein KinB [Pseudomonas guineae]